MSKEIFELIDQLKAAKDLHKDYLDEELITYQRDTYRDYNGKPSFSVWRVLLDESKSKYCVRDSVGFRVVVKYNDCQKIEAIVGVKSLILSKDKKSRELGRTILDQIAEKKYGSKE